ncbi:MAG TPA: RNA polymerase sigma factor [Candidatus Krumholzibacteria bacterium]|nr:RNA polymerase sigma factor [Candidatus Krumholzibacteria bacterium]HPD71902.1 RNA polymerase sigma factor [Candidatus Krumholzibacteria bacterium]HRY41165.1 RNA polymerase sigma factor [Candidatus Krumholzibacteria bacterium]
MNDFEILYRQHAAELLRFAWGLCGDRSTAEDLVSETFVRLLVRAPRIETRTALAYLLAVVRNTYLTGQRRRRREVPLDEDLPSPARDLCGDLDQQTRLETVLRALDDLSEGERAALLLRVDHNLSYEDIAAALAISIAAAKVRVHRARLRLASALDEQGR